ncbi:YkvA family protein [Sulfurovum sp. zt1-1]|uniref:YkvA family protein n=1 Tax=Sulfurovum zhangzhouensis TaxID=3019067 RepID=A0ABT7QVH6_9BACT|nr:YkvA family protein [Sulfurovum zhangzhouensis]MDM5270845.1 YkvA family protein [Sulfurovum zhangzhouensis]
MIEKLKTWAKHLKHYLYALYLAYHHKDVPIVAKIMAVIVVSYALSPVDLIPDFIPIIGYLDDFILLPLGIALAIKLIPEEIWSECKNKAQQATLRSLPRSKTAAFVVISIWIIIAVLIFRMFY